MPTLIDGEPAVGALSATLARVTALVPYLTAEIDPDRLVGAGPPEGDRPVPAEREWVPSAAVIDDPAWLARIISSTGRRMGTADPVVATSAFVQGYSYRVLTLTVACLTASSNASQAPIPGCGLPTPDPNELFSDMTDQIFGQGIEPPAPPTMTGFAQNYAKIATNDPKAVMHGFSPNQLPVLSALAKAFGVCDRWHASAPNQTWPNRFFVHTGTAAGHVNNSPPRFPYEMPNIFNKLTAKQCSWRIYYHDIPQAATLTQIWSELPDHLYSFEEDFMADAMSGRLPNYSFIEPRYFSDPLLCRMPND